MAEDAIVLGAGIGGLACAVGLRTLGWQVEVRERQAAVDDRGAALGLWPEAQRGLERLGVARHLAGDWVPYRDAVVRRADGRTLAALPLARVEAREGRPIVLVNRRQVLHALLARLAELGVRPRFGVTATDVGTWSEVADLVVGADGIRSTVRPLVDPRAAGPRDLGATAWRGSCPGTAAPYGETWGRGLVAGVTPGGRGRTNWYVAVSDRHPLDSFDAVRDAVRAWPSPIADVLARTDPAEVLRHRLLDLPPPARYAAGRFVLLGDAAHAMAPALGQGACQAVLDAVALADCLREQPAVDAALRTYDRRRRPVG